MRIGVQAPRRKECFGGAATFEQELFKGLVAGVREYGHTLVVYSLFARPDDLSNGDCIEWVRVRWVGLQNVLANVRRIINWRFTHILELPTPFRREHWIDKYLSDSHVEFFLNLIPATIPSEVPYMVFVWDTMHRGLPFFPECSQRGAWSRREQHFKLLIGRASVVAVGTTTGKDDLARLYQTPVERVCIIPYPTPSFALTGTSTSQFAKSEIASRIGEEYVLYPAGFHAHKNHVTALLALALLRDRHGVNMHMVLTGADWGNLSHVKDVVSRLALDRQVHFCGFVSRTELVELYRGALALVFPSLLGPDNIPPLEAFGLGCPAIVGNVPGAAEQMDGAALLFPPTDEEALVEAILKVRGNPELRGQLITLGRLRAAKYTSRSAGLETLRVIAQFEKIRRCWSSKSSYPGHFNVLRLLGE